LANTGVVWPPLPGGWLMVSRLVTVLLISGAECDPEVRRAGVPQLFLDDNLLVPPRNFSLSW